LTSDLTQTPRITIGVLNWNSGPYLEGCLSAIYAQTYSHYQIHLIDNGSTDGSVAYVRERFPGVIVHETGRNLGYGAGNNVVLRSMTDDLVLLLNPDVVLSPDCLARLVEAMAADPAIGIAGCKLWYPGGEILQHAGGFITAPRAIPNHHGIGEKDRGQYQTQRDVDYVIGAAMAIRREALATTGLFDEGIFLYFEDSDLCYRMRRAGYRVVYIPTATATHIESATTQPGSFGYLSRFHTGRWYFLLKHFDYDILVEGTIPAESTWLEGLGDLERRAVAIAYRATLYNLPNIASVRAQNGAGPLADAAWNHLEQGLQALVGHASTEMDERFRLAELEKLGTPMTSPFTSTTPFIGPIIARIRMVWNDMAGRWYIEHLARQQATFNRGLIAYLKAMDAELRSRQTLIEEKTITQIALRRRAKTLEALVREKKTRSD
jgi:GT2 family glycosyltransferase